MLGGKDRRFKVTVALTAVYLVWGSSYVATKMMVAEEPPLVAAGLRFVLAGCLLGLFAAWRGELVPRGANEWRTIALCALTNVVASNGCNVVAMQHVPSNVAALLNATPALWIAWLGTFGHRRVPLPGSAKLGLLIGLVGVALILMPEGGMVPEHFRWQLVILLGCVGWSIGTIIYRNAAPRTSATMFTALHMLVGGMALLVLAPALGERYALALSVKGLTALLWLTLMSSCVAYTAYSWLVHNTTPVVVGTYGYVNPAIAALIGWLVLGETLAWPQVAGLAIVFLAVALVTGYLSPLFARSAPPPAGEP
jgi:drug/metabolite transporter (DMT)-like permease